MISDKLLHGGWKSLDENTVLWFTLSDDNLKTGICISTSGKEKIKHKSNYEILPNDKIKIDADIYYVKELTQFSLKLASSDDTDLIFDKI